MIILCLILPGPVNYFTYAFQTKRLSAARLYNRHASMPSRMGAKQFGKGKNNGHEAHMYAVLPFQRSAQISAWLESVYKTIDYPYNSYFEGLRNAPHQKFS